MKEKTKVSVIGGGLAGCEAAFQLARNNIYVDLYEMRPFKMTPAHKTGGLGELVCSNSFKGIKIQTAHGLLKEEIRFLGSILMKIADFASLPAGGALAVDRDLFSRKIEENIANNKYINLKRECIENFIPGPLIIASGPLTDKTLWDYLGDLIGNQLYFFDAVAPVVYFDSVDMSVAFKGSRYINYEVGDKNDCANKPEGENKIEHIEHTTKGDYLNCPMNKNEYEIFYRELVSAERISVKDFEKNMLFEGCMPIEEMADRGFDTIRFGPMKPVGFIDPRTGNQPFALVQLRQDNLAGTIYNMVGFQTRLKFSEQKRVFRMIPGLDKAVFARYGVMHRNCYLNSPQILDKTLFIKQINQPVMAAGQITGVEGYVESIAIGLVAGLNMSRYILGRKILDYPSDTMLGSLIEYISGQTRLLNQGCRGNFSPMPANFGILPDIKVKRGPDKKSRKKQARAQRSFKSLSLFVEKL